MEALVLLSFRLSLYRRSRQLCRFSDPANVHQRIPWRRSNPVERLLRRRHKPDSFRRVRPGRTDLSPRPIDQMVAYAKRQQADSDPPWLEGWAWTRRPPI